MALLRRLNRGLALLPFLAPLAERVARPAIDRVKHQVHRTLVALALIGVGVASAVVGLAYFASSLWHALVPFVGTVGADLVLGTCYGTVALVTIVLGLRLVRA